MGMRNDIRRRRRRRRRRRDVKSGRLNELIKK
jgi:hypothetical protein